MNIIQELEREQIGAIFAKRSVPEFGPGDTVKVMVKVIEGMEVDPKDKRKAKAEEPKGAAVSLAGLRGRRDRPLGQRHQREFHGAQDFLRRGCRARFPVYSPYITEIEVLRRGKVRRAKLYYLRGRRGKSARIFERTDARAKRLNAASRASSGRRAKPMISPGSKGSMSNWPAASISSVPSSSNKSPISPTMTSPISTRRYPSRADREAGLGRSGSAPRRRIDRGGSNRRRDAGLNALTAVSLSSVLRKRRT